jgi:hypothetical protein
MEEWYCLVYLICDQTNQNLKIQRPDFLWTFLNATIQIVVGQKQFKCCRNLFENLHNSLWNMIKIREVKGKDNLFI